MGRFVNNDALLELIKRSIIFLGLYLLEMGRGRKAGELGPNLVNTNTRNDALVDYMKWSFYVPYC
jgi:hypothetical protein